MNNKELQVILDKHKLWLHTDGKDGARANLSKADLYEANLSKADLYGANLSEAILNNIKNKQIITFQSGKDFAYYCDGYVKIGCKYLSLAEWLENYVTIGENNHYSDDEIYRYGIWLYSLQEMVK